MSTSFAVSPDAAAGRSPPLRRASTPVRWPHLREFALLPPPTRAAPSCVSTSCSRSCRSSSTWRDGTAATAATREELTQVGTVALITAIDRWNPDAGPGGVPRLPHPVRARGDAALVPRPDLGGAGAAQAQGAERRRRKATEPLAQELGRAPRPSELAARLGVGVGDIIDALDARANQIARLARRRRPRARRVPRRADRLRRCEPGEGRVPARAAAVARRAART